MDLTELFTEKKANNICEKIAKAVEENKIVGSAQIIAYAA